MINEEIFYTDSALRDRIKETWALYKDETNENHLKRYAGNYYFQSIYDSIIFKQPLEIKIKHFDNELQQQLNKLSFTKLQEIIYNAIKEFLQTYTDSGFIFLAEKENRIKWKFI